MNTVGVCGGAVAPSLDESALFNASFAATLTLVALVVLALEGPSLGRGQVETAEGAPA